MEKYLKKFQVKMYVSKHISLGIIFCLFLLILFPEINTLNLVILFLSSVLIDVDHYLYFAFKNKSISLKNAYFWFIDFRAHLEKFKKKNKGKNIKAPFCIFHTIEFHVLILLLSLFFPILLYVLSGILFHSLVDIVDLVSRKSLYLREYSLILFFKRRNRANWRYV